jgi:hypothetical protein
MRLVALDAMHPADRAALFAAPREARRTAPRAPSMARSRSVDEQSFSRAVRSLCARMETPDGKPSTQKGTHMTTTTNAQTNGKARDVRLSRPCGLLLAELPSPRAAAENSEE